MLKLNSLSIKQRVVVGITFAVLASTIIVGALSQYHARKMLSQRLTQIELPASLNKIKTQIDNDTNGMLQAGQQLVENQFVKQFISTTDRDPKTEALVIKQLNTVIKQYHLEDASVANRNTDYYWKQTGFLRQFTEAEDPWFFKFVRSGVTSSVAVYVEKDGSAKMYANYQDINGFTLAGLSKSVDDMVALLNSFKIEKTGYVFLTDNSGNVKIHNSHHAQFKSLQKLVGSKVNSLLNKQHFNLIQTNINGQDMFVSSLYVPAMHWFVVGVVPVHEVFATLDKTTQSMLLTTLIVAIIFIIMGIFLANSITRPIKQLAERFVRLGQGDGDLSLRIEAQGEDEIAQLSNGFNGFLDKIHLTMKEVAVTSHSLNIAAEGVSTKAALTSTNSQVQRDQTLQVVTAINQMGSTINEIANNAATAAEIANQAADNTQSGSQIVTQAKDVINHLATDVESTSQVVAQLATTTTEIGTILDVIRDISDQTNLLALNAAIEAARAGEQGRGFSVVADEVRNLASRTATSTEEIQKMINQLQNDAKEAVNAMNSGKEITLQGVDSTEEAVSVLADISEQVIDISDRNTQVATATEEQSTVVQTINHNIEEINTINETTTQTSDELASASRELQELSNRLDEMVGSFKL